MKRAPEIFGPPRGSQASPPDPKLNKSAKNSGHYPSTYASNSRSHLLIAALLNVSASELTCARLNVQK